jgi:D-alanyl-D-alanine carboxypeptidase
MIAEAAAPLPAPPIKLASLAAPPGAIPAPPSRSAAGQIEEGDEDSAEEAVPAPAVVAAKPAALPLATKPAALPLATKPAALPLATKPAAAAVAAKPVVAAVAAPTAPVAPRPAPNVVAAASPGQLGWVKGPDPVDKGPSRDVAPSTQTKAATTVAAETAPAPTDRGGWIIQIGVSDDAAKANDLLARARAQNQATLAQARPFTEKVAKGEDVFYRARFAGLDSASAETACRSLKKSGFACFAARD